MDSRAKGIIGVLAICLAASVTAAILKIFYGFSTESLAFVADGIHSVFDSTATVLGMLTIWIASKPPDEGHPYGHAKFELLAALVLSALLMFAAFEVGVTAKDRLFHPDAIPSFSPYGIGLVLMTIAINLGLARLEKRKSKEYDSPFLAADSAHNYADIATDLGALMALASARLRLPYVDSAISLLIALYLVFLSIRLIVQNMNPLVDRRILEAKDVIEVAKSVKGVKYAHNVRSRGLEHQHFLDLNIHLPGSMSLEEAHRITHQVEESLKEKFPGLKDVVIHTEPEGHPPCSKEDFNPLITKK